MGRGQSQERLIMQQRISMVTLGVKHMAKARKFYERLGWTASSHSNENVVFFDMGGFVFGLFGRDALAEESLQDPKGSGFRAHSISYNTRSEEEVDATLAEAVAAGAMLVKPGEKVFWGGYSGYFSDPDGHLWEVAHNPFAPLDEDGRMQMGEGTT